MTSGTEQAARQREALRPEPPRVSVIVVNYNYGRYLRDAVQSVQEQTYRHIEMILVDNASTDESAAILDELEESCPALRIIRRTENGGQSVASAEGYRSATGDYVIFLDADDYLLPRAVETHVYAHLCLRIPVGFTSGDILQCVDNRTVVSTSPAFSDFVRSGKGRVPGLGRCIAGLVPFQWATSEDAPVSLDALHYRAPPTIAPWVWSPTSANCFRRDALHVVLAEASLAKMVSGTDTYLMHGISSLMGSVLIDTPVAVYRLHAKNVFSRHPSLNGLRSFDDAGAKNNNDTATLALIDHFIDRATSIAPRLHNGGDFIRALDAVNDIWPRPTSRIPGCPTYLSEKVYGNFQSLAGLFGWFNVLVWLIKLRTAPWVALRAALAARRADAP